MDHGLQKGDELRDRSTAELNEAAVVRVRLWEPEGTGGGPAADFLDGPQERSPGIWIPAPTTIGRAGTVRRSLAFVTVTSHQRREARKPLQRSLYKQEDVDGSPAWPD
jgi:hypothetical protein